MIHSIFRIFRKTVPLSFQGVGEKGKKGVQIGLFIFYTQELTASKTTHPKEILTGVPKNPKVSFLEYIYIYRYTGIYKLAATGKSEAPGVPLIHFTDRAGV